MGKDEKPKPGVKINFGDLRNADLFAGMSEEEKEKLRKDAEKMISDAMKGGGGLFGNHVPFRRGGGDIFVEGMEAFAERFGVGENQHWGSRIVTMNDLIDSMPKVIWEVAMRVWDYPVDWHFAVTNDRTADTVMLTAQYFDPDGEADTPLVNETATFTYEALEQNYEDLELLVERSVSVMKEKCDADLAAFE